MNIKKILSVVALSLGGFVVANAANFGWGSNDLAHINKGGLNTSITMNSGATLNMSYSSGNANTTFGFYTIDPSTMAISERFGTSANFSAGDIVGVWMEFEGNTYFSTHSLNNPSITYDGWIIDGENWKLGFELDGKPYNGFDNLDVYLDVSAKPGPTGQPMPGVLATSVIAGLAIILVIRSRKLFKR